jgi:erythromycin esterase
MRTRLVLAIILLSYNLFGQESIEGYIAHHAKEINESGVDFKGLSFLDTVLKNKRIVMLGESSHGTEEYSSTKFQLIRYLHEKLGFNVVLFESPMMPCSYVNIAGGESAEQLLVNSIQHIWHTNTVLQLFQYIKTNKLFFGGFDPQFMLSPHSPLVISHAFNDYPGIKNELLQLERRIVETTVSRKYLSLADSFSRAYSAIIPQLEKRNLTPLQQWVKHMVGINTQYYSRINDGDQRDLCMAKNIIWLADSLYPNEKIIIWAHNTHIDRMATSKKRLMGKLVADHFKEQLFVTGLYMINGTTAMNNRSIVQVKTPMKGSLEDILGARGYKTAFIQTGHPVFDKKITTLHWGRDKQQLNLFNSYQAVILINGVKPPRYLENIAADR